MELWFTMENYGTMEKTMVLRTKLWYYTKNYGTLIYEEKKHGRLLKTKRLWFIMEKTMEKYQNNWVLNRFIALELWFTMEKIMILWEKTMVLYRKLWYYTENYGTLIYYGKNYGTMEKTMVL